LLPTPNAPEVLVVAKLWPPMMESLHAAFQVHDRTHETDPAAFDAGRASHPRDRRERRVEGQAAS
jgi:hypothetical protein